jgi:hypothetical protein
MAYVDMDNLQEHVAEHGPKDSLVCVETVRGRMEGFTVEQVKRATEARDAVAMMAHPPVEKLKRLVSTTNVIKNIPILMRKFSLEKTEERYEGRQFGKSLAK